MTITLQDPQSGTTVYLRQAELAQKCRFCGAQLQGVWAVATEVSGWVCLEHTARVLMGLEMSSEVKAQAAARDQLGKAVPGDKVTVTRVLLAALGLGPKK